MRVYVCALLITIVGCAIFYLRVRFAKSNKKPSVFINITLSENEQQEYTEAAKKCQKINSPVLNEPFNQIVMDGAYLVCKDAFRINDKVVEGSGYCVR